MPKEQCITQLHNFILFSFVPTRYHKKKKKNNMGHFEKWETLKLALGVDVWRGCSIFENAPQNFMLHNMTCKYTRIFCPMLALH
jgi:hypothetical protein